MSYGEGAKLVATRPGRPGQEYPLGNRPLVIGREPGCDIVVDSPVVSRRHAQIAPQGGEYVVSDAGATNGLFVNGQRIAGAQTLTPGDKIQIGEEVFVFIPAPSDTMSTQIVRPSSASPAGPRPPPARPAPPPPEPEEDMTSVLPPPNRAGASPPFQAPPPPSTPPPYQAPPSPPGYGTQPVYGQPSYGQPPPWQNQGFNPAAPSDAAVADFGRRLGAYLLDGLIVSAGVTIGIIVILILGLFFRALGDAGDILATIFYFVLYPILFLAIAGYYVWGFANGQTYGAKFLHLRIKDQITGGPPGYGKGFLRVLVYGVAAFIPFGVLIDCLWMLWDPGRQTLHDKVAGTIVVYEP